LQILLNIIISYIDIFPLKHLVNLFLRLFLLISSFKYAFVTLKEAFENLFVVLIFQAALSIAVMVLFPYFLLVHRAFGFS